MVVIIVLAILKTVFNVNLEEPKWIKNMIEAGFVFYLAYLVNDHFQKTTRRIIREELNARFGETP
jgi:hypothetical protein